MNEDVNTATNNNNNNGTVEADERENKKKNTKHVFKVKSRSYSPFKWTKVKKAALARQSHSKRKIVDSFTHFSVY